MLRLHRLPLVACGLASLLVATGCNVLQTNDSEQTKGRGSQAFDPYAGSNSGAIKLALQNFKGCEVLPTGEVMSKGAANIPYPDTCFSFLDSSTAVVPTRPLPLKTNTKYFLGRLTLMDTTSTFQFDPTQPGQGLDWLKNESMFRFLDWTGAGVTSDTTERAVDANVPDDFQRVVLFGNAAWMLDTAQTFTVDVLDQSGTPRSTPVVYNRTDFLAENPVTQHIVMGWMIADIQAPKYPGDKSATPLPGAADGEVGPPSASTVARFDLSQSTNPFKTFTVPDGLTGDGAIRVIWSAMPNHPFYFPVHFQSDTDGTCYSADGKTKVKCDFGLDPEVTLSTPANGKGFYEAGETFDVNMLIKDASGNLLHEPGRLPSYSSYLSGNSNGLQYFNPGYTFGFLEADGVSGSKVVGPVQNLRVQYDETKNPIYFDNRPGSPDQDGKPELTDAESLAASNIFPGVGDQSLSSRYSVTLPKDAVPGTYVALLKVHRAFMGERVSKMGAFLFQVGQTQQTRPPGRVGNCQICHRGALSLDNLHHGLSVDQVETCKVCHFKGREMVQAFHQIHMLSTKYPKPKNDCTVCHLTRESATRPSLQVCEACHPLVHGGQFFAMEFAGPGQPNRYSNCAQACHVKTTPTKHILPAQ